MKAKEATCTARRIQCARCRDLGIIDYIHRGDTYFILEHGGHEEPCCDACFDRLKEQCEE